MPRWLRKLELRGRSLFRRAQVERDLQDELAFHLEQLTAAEISKGRTPDEARQVALRTIRGIEAVKESCRDARRTMWLEHAARDIAYAVRRLRATLASYRGSW